MRNDRGFSDRNERPTRPERDHYDRGERSVADRNERGARPARDFSDRGDRSVAERNDRNVRGPRGFNDRNERIARPTRTSATSKSGHREAVVSFFNDSKGFGFASDDKGDDLFIHFSSIQGDGFKSLSQGQKIIFEEANGPKGREARNVRVVGGARERRY